MANELELKDIMASIKVAFKQRAVSLIKVGSKGAVLVVLKNEEFTVNKSSKVSSSEK